jgi:hypothetical protein
MKANCSRGRRWQTLASLCATLRCSCGTGNWLKGCKRSWRGKNRSRGRALGFFRRQNCRFSKLQRRCSPTRSIWRHRWRLG